MKCSSVKVRKEDIRHLCFCKSLSVLSMCRNIVYTNWGLATLHRSVADRPTSPICPIIPLSPHPYKYWQCLFVSTIIIIILSLSLDHTILSLVSLWQSFMTSRLWRTRRWRGCWPDTSWGWSTEPANRLSCLTSWLTSTRHQHVQTIIRYAH